MATFTNYATLFYNGGTVVSNTVTGELLEALAVTKTAVVSDYTARDTVTFVIALVNRSTAALNDLTLTDDLGGYPFGGSTVYPLSYVAGSVRYYVNGSLRAEPAVMAGPPMTLMGISVPAGGNAILIYEARVTDYAPLASDATIVNTVAVTGSGLSVPVTAMETIAARNRADLAISKAVRPAVVMENDSLTYTFILENLGNTPAVATDNLVLTDTFDPVLDLESVTFNGVFWTEGVQYTYNRMTGVFATRPGQIVVPAATYSQNPDGTWTTTPGTAIFTVTGTVS